MMVMIMMMIITSTMIMMMMIMMMVASSVQPDRGLPGFPRAVLASAVPRTNIKNKYRTLRRRLQQRGGRQFVL